MAGHTNVLLIDDEASAAGIFEPCKACVFEISEFSVVLGLWLHTSCVPFKEYQALNLFFCKKYMQTLFKKQAENHAHFKVEC